ncbi:ABC transporter ATP-binding protein [Aquihabitans daechungensis]|uniref:ABC transporter ATP-binding protein n=1 Tax=Aquihabitans daechungensis TaxID=1052257 RepID=UPI003B9F416B
MLSSISRRRVTANDPTLQAPDRSLWNVYRPLFANKTGSLVGMAISSFISGVTEAAMLVVIASLALSIGSGTADGDSELAGTLGPFGDLDLSLEVAFGVAVALGIARFVSQLVSAHLAARVTSDLTISARAGTLADFSGASWSEQSRRSQSDIQDLLIRHVNRTGSAMSVLATAVSTVFTLGALLVSAVLVDPISAVLLAVSGALLFLLIRPLTRIAKQVSKRQQEAGLAFGSRSLEAIDMSLEIRAFGVTEQVNERLAEATEEEAKPIYESMILRQLVISMYQLITIAILLAGLFAVHAFLDRELASLGAIVIILIRALNQAGALQSAYHSMTETAPYVERLQDERKRFREEVPVQGHVSLNEPKHLVFDDVSYGYEADRLAIHDVSFEVTSGEAIGIIGPSGSGKSTLTQLLLRLREPTSGAYRIDGIDTSEFADDAWFSNIAFVPQDSHVIDDTIAANIAFYREATHDQIVRAAQRAHVHEEILAMPDGYDTVLGSRGGALSGGQRQRISIARALLRQPAILVLDEPTSALDMRSESLVHETFTELREQVTIFVIAHRLSTLNTCDRIMVMSAGRLQAFGTRSELEADSEFYRDVLELSQLRS